MTSLFWRLQDLQHLLCDQSLTRSLCPPAWCPSIHYDPSLQYSLCSHPLSPSFDQLLLCCGLLDSTLPVHLPVSLPSGSALVILALQIILGPSLLWQRLSPQSPSHHAVSLSPPLFLGCHGGSLRPAECPGRGSAGVHDEWVFSRPLSLLGSSLTFSMCSLLILL